MFAKKKNRFFEILIESAFRLSGSTTTIVIVLISVFLFTEGMGLFKKSSIEEGYVLCVGKDNRVEEISSEQIKKVFDWEITNWKELGGEDMEILPLRLNDLSSYFTEEQLGPEFENVPACINQLMLENPAAIGFFPVQFIDINYKAKVLPHQKIKYADYFGGQEWFPTATPSPQFGLMPLLLGTLWVSLGAILLALPFGLAAAIYLAEIANDRIRKILKPLIELLAGIPSVVYGFFGLIVIVPLIRDMLKLDVGETALAGSIILAIMALPTIITVAEDALRTTPRAMKESSLALGATHWQTIFRVVVPYASSGIMAALVLGIGRAIGETMAVLMVTGNAAIIPTSFTDPVRTIPATIAAELGEASVGGMQYQALFLLGAILFVITLLLSIWSEVIRKEPRLE